MKKGVIDQFEADQLLSNRNDYPLTLPRRALRSAMFRTGLDRRLGRRYWQPTEMAPYIHVPYRRTVEMFNGIPADFADSIYGAMIGRDSANWSRFEEMISAIDDCWVEPNRCHIIGPDGRMVAQTLAHRITPVFPSAWGYAFRGKGTEIDEAIVYDGRSSLNYYHHLIDGVVGVPLFLERSGLPRDLPLIINRWSYESKFFDYLRRRSPLFGGLNWRVQEPGEWLRVKRAYRLTAAPFEPDSFAKVRAMYGRVAEPAGKRIFLSRDSAMYGRGIHNQREVATLLAGQGFETVYAEHLTMEEQQRTFEQATHLVALQGMGLIQQMFMDPDQGHVLELMPSNRLQSEYYWQGWTLGMRFYDVQTGSAIDQSGKFHVDLGRLDAGVRRMLDHPADMRRYGETLNADDATGAA